jgi:hypothetical protein
MHCKNLKPDPPGTQLASRTNLEVSARPESALHSDVSKIPPIAVKAIIVSANRNKSPDGLSLNCTIPTISAPEKVIP